MELELVLLTKAIALNVNQDNIAVIMVPRHPLGHAPLDIFVLKVELGRLSQRDCPLKLCPTHRTMIFYAPNITIALPEVSKLILVPKALSETRKAAAQKLLARTAVRENIAPGLDKDHSRAKLVSFVKMVQKYQIQAQKRTRQLIGRQKAVISAQQVITVCQTRY